MRIIAGRWRGRRLQAPPGRGTRPMLDRVRESLFSVLGDRVEGATVWDLFAGSGSLGLEALSRGAARAWFVERGRGALGALRANLELLLGAAGSEVLVTGDAWVPAVPADPAPGVVFLDPPYPQVKADPVLVRGRLVALCARLAPGGVVAFHYDATTPEGGTVVAGLGGEVRVWGTSAIALVGPADGGEQRT